MRWSALILIVVALAAAFGPALLPFSADIPDWAHAALAPSWASGHLLGTDAIGRDVLARSLIGARLSLAVGVIAALAAVGIGLLYGALAGYRGGAVERLMMRSLDVISALPFLLIVVLLLTVFGRSLPLLFAAVAGYVWIDFARVVRAEAARLRGMPYIEMAQLMGGNTFYVLRRHLIPQLLPLALVYLGVLVPQAILVESFLSFLGLSVSEPGLSLGGLVFEGTQEMLETPWTLLVPALLLAGMVFCANRLADALADRSQLRAALA